MESDRCKSPSHRVPCLAPISFRSAFYQKLYWSNWSPYCSFHCCQRQHSRETAERGYYLRSWGFKPTINGSDRANNSQVIWIQLLWIERKCGLTESPANYIEWKNQQLSLIVLTKANACCWPGAERIERSYHVLYQIHKGLCLWHLPVHNNAPYIFDNS